VVPETEGNGVKPWLRSKAPSTRASRRLDRALVRQSRRAAVEGAHLVAFGD
jgi:hypothetical protein